MRILVTLLLLATTLTATACTGQSSPNTSVPTTATAPSPAASNPPATSTPAPPAAATEPEPKPVQPESDIPPTPAATERDRAGCSPAADPATVKFVANDPTVTDRIFRLFRDDQSARQGDITKLDWLKVNAEDQQRREEVWGYLTAGKVTKPATLVNAAFIFQHGNCPAHYLVANLLARRAMIYGEQSAAWIYAATLDRYLMNLGKPQKFGTQYRTNAAGVWELYQVDPATTDQERSNFDVPTLAQAKARADAMNAQKTN